jgi:hypothetical protein
VDDDFHGRKVAQVAAEARNGATEPLRVTESDRPGRRNVLTDDGLRIL